MAYALYSNGQYLGPLAPVGLYFQMVKTVEQYDRSRSGAGRVSELASLCESGETDNIPKALRDLSKLLASGERMPPNLVRAFQNLKKLLMKAKFKATVGEA